LENTVWGTGVASTGAALMVRGAAASMLRIEVGGFNVLSSNFAGIHAGSSVAVSGFTYLYRASRSIEGG
jgi:hypothetical protein